MRLLTEDARIVCAHELGTVAVEASQGFVTVARRRVLVATDPEGRPIRGCPNVGATTKPCALTLQVRSGYSEWLRIDRRQVCLDSVVGLTDGTPPGTVRYKVNVAGQSFVHERGAA